MIPALLLLLLLPQDDLQDRVRKAVWEKSGEALKSLKGEKAGKVAAAIRKGREYPELFGDRETLTVDLDENTSVRVYVRIPPEYDPKKSYPLMIAIGGGPTGDRRQARQQARMMGAIWNKAAAEAGWFVAAVQDDVSIRTQARPLRYHILTTDHARRIIDKLFANYNIDPDRVHSTGVSLGSNYSLAYAEAHPDWFAGVVPVSTEGESREACLRNLKHVSVYTLEGVKDKNIKAIQGPRTQAKILTNFKYRHQYVEHKDRGHEAFEEKYPDVLKWLAKAPRKAWPKEVLRMAHPGIMLPGKRFYWIEGDTHQACFLARVDGNAITVDAARVKTLTFHLSDELLDLDKPVVITVNGKKVLEKTLTRSIETMVRDARLLNDPKRFAMVRVTVDVPNLKAGEQWHFTMTPTVAPGKLAYWEGFALDTLREERPKLPAYFRQQDGRMFVTAAPKESRLKEGDRILTIDGDPIFIGTDGAEILKHYVLRAKGEVLLRILRDGEEKTIRLR